MTSDFWKEPNYLANVHTGGIQVRITFIILCLITKVLVLFWGEGGGYYSIVSMEVIDNNVNIGMTVSKLEIVYYVT